MLRHIVWVQLWAKLEILDLFLSVKGNQWKFSSDCDRILFMFLIELGQGKTLREPENRDCSSRREGWKALN